jgi:pimeloyl-ACP methyl ester carboxylesterase
MADAGEVFVQSLGGGGPLTLLLHGFGADRLSWLANQPALEGIASIAALDLPGHGASGMDVGDGRIETLAARVAAALDARGLTGAHLVGHSLGGGVAIVLAARRPELAASLTLIAPAGLGTAVDADFLAAYPTLNAPGDAEALLQRLVVRPRLIGKPLVARVLQQLEKPGARDALARVAAGIARSADALDEAVANLAASDLPRLVIWGEDDGINPISPSRLAAFGGELRFVPQAAHLPHIENPRLVNEAIAAFLGGVFAASR